MIKLKGLTKTYKVGKETLKAADNVNLSIESGQFVSILGHSGSGKTTLLNLIGGLTKPDSGSVLIDGTDIWGISDNELSELRNLKINFIYQFSSLISTLNVIENVMLPTAFSKSPSGKEYELGMELLGAVGIKEKEKSYPSELSGGQQRRAAIVRAFINSPRIVLADEPTGDLDEETEREIMDLFLRMNTQEGVTFVLVTHNSKLAGEAGRRLRMTNGAVEEL